jgi:plasmid stabilization system protein ParE
MKVVYTAAALGDLAEIAGWLSIHYPSIAPAVEQRIRQVVSIIGRWPESAPRSGKRPGVRAASVGTYPYKIFYRVADDAVEILHIHHAARRPWDED